MRAFSFFGRGKEVAAVEQPKAERSENNVLIFGEESDPAVRQRLMALVRDGEEDPDRAERLFLDGRGDRLSNHGFLFVQRKYVEEIAQKEEFFRRAVDLLERQWGYVSRGKKGTCNIGEKYFKEALLFFGISASPETLSSSLTESAFYQKQEAHAGLKEVCQGLNALDLRDRESEQRLLAQARGDRERGAIAENETAKRDLRRHLFVQVAKSVYGEELFSLAVEYEWMVREGKNLPNERK